MRTPFVTDDQKLDRDFWQTCVSPVRRLSRRNTNMSLGLPASPHRQVFLFFLCLELCLEFALGKHVRVLKLVIGSICC